jgi:uncharacterized protein YdhG (YjbR/CyaY superfamily)
MKIRKKVNNISEYIQDQPKDIRKSLKTLRQAIKKIAPGAKEEINYGIPTFKLNGNLVHFASFKEHIGFFPTPSAIIKFKKELTPYKTSKGTIRFPPDKPLPLALIRKIVRYGVKENLK